MAEESGSSTPVRDNNNNNNNNRPQYTLHSTPKDRDTRKGAAVYPSPTLGSVLELLLKARNAKEAALKSFLKAKEHMQKSIDTKDALLKSKNAVIDVLMLKCISQVSDAKSISDLLPFLDQHEALREQEESSRKHEETIRKQNVTIADHLETITALQEDADRTEATIRNHLKLIQEQTFQLQARSTRVAQLGATIRRQQVLITKQNVTFSEDAVRASQQEANIRELEVTLKKQNRVINEYRDSIEPLEEEASKAAQYESIIREQWLTIGERDVTIREHERTIREQNLAIVTRRETIKQLQEDAEKKAQEASALKETLESVRAVLMQMRSTNGSADQIRTPEPRAPHAQLPQPCSKGHPSVQAPGASGDDVVAPLTLGNRLLSIGASMTNAAKRVASNRQLGKKD